MGSELTKLYALVAVAFAFVFVAGAGVGWLVARWVK